MSSEGNSNSRVYRLLLGISSSTKIADLLVSPKTTLPYILTASGAPGWLIPLLVPIKESGSLIPQWLLKTTVSKRFGNRTSLWRIGALTQGLGILFLVASIALFTEQLLAASVLGLLILISFGRSICSLSMKDIQAESIAKGERGKLIGLASSISGGLTMVSSAVFLLSDQPLTQGISYGLLIVGGLLFLLSMLFSLPLSVRYSPESSEQENMQHFWRTITEEKNLRHIILSRILMLHSALIVPYIVASAVDSTSTTSQLPFFVGLSAFASLISSYIWGMYADKGAITTLRIAATVCILSALTFAIGLDELTNTMKLMLFFLLTLGHAGIRTGRKTYLLDITERSNRTGYVAAGNTCVGIGLLLLGGFYALLSNYIDENVVMVMTIVMILGLAHTVKLKSVKS